jgi:hypothetical protein
VETIFGGYLCNYCKKIKYVLNNKFYFKFLVKCLNCGKISRNLDYFLDLPLDIPIQKVSSLVRSKTKSKPQYTGFINNKDQKENEQIFNENNDGFINNFKEKKFSLITIEELNGLNFPNFDKDNNDLYEPGINLDNLKSSPEKVFS